MFFAIRVSRCRSRGALLTPSKNAATPICSFSAKCEEYGLQNALSSNISVNIQAIDNLLERLKNASLQSPYSKQQFSPSE